MGGQGLVSAVACGTTEYLDYLYFNPANMENGKDSMPGFRGVFAMPSPTPTNHDFVNRTTSGADTVLTWTLLPGVSSAIDGIAVIAKNIAVGGNSEQGYGPDGIDCEDLEKKQGYKLVTTISPSTTTVTVPGAAYSNPNVALCPYKSNLLGFARRYFYGAAFLSSAQGSGGMTYNPLGFGDGSDGNQTVAASSISDVATYVLSNSRKMNPSQYLTGLATDGKTMTTFAAFGADLAVNLYKTY
jgi:hypothetical protein